MSCLWCSDEKLARSLLRALCQEDFQDDNTKETAMLDLCYCIYCVREYHRQKHEYIKKHPEHTKVLYKIEVDRLGNHFKEKLDARKGKDDSVAQLTDYELEDNLRAPLTEMLQFPYLLFNKELMEYFIDGFLILSQHGKFDKLDGSYPGVYLLLVNPVLQVRRWAVARARDMGTIHMEDFDEFKPVIDCILKIVLFDLVVCTVDNLPVPIAEIDQEILPHPFMFMPTSKKTLWLAYGAVFNALANNVLQMFFRSDGNAQILDMLKGILEGKDQDAIEAFWAVLHIMKTLMQKLGYSLWLLANFDDAPTTLFELITEHTSFRVKINSLQDKMFYSPRKQPIILSDASSEDEITLSQMVYCGKDKGNTLECGDTQGSSQLFDWVILLIKTVLDLEEVADKVIKNIIDYLLSLLSGRFYLGCKRTELDFIVLESLVNILKYIIERKMIAFVNADASRWIDIICSIVFHNQESLTDHRSQSQESRWTRIVDDAQNLMVLILDQQSKSGSIRVDETLRTWMSSYKATRDQKSQEIIIFEVRRVLLEKIKELSEQGISAAFDDSDHREEEDERLVVRLISSKDSFEVAGITSLEVVEESSIPGTNEANRDSFVAGTGTKDEPILISDSDDEEVETQGKGPPPDVEQSNTTESQMAGTEKNKRPDDWDSLVDVGDDDSMFEQELSQAAEKNPSENEPSPIRNRIKDLRIQLTPIIFENKDDLSSGTTFSLKSDDEDLLEDELPLSELKRTFEAFDNIKKAAKWYIHSNRQITKRRMSNPLDPPLPSKRLCFEASDTTFNNQSLEASRETSMADSGAADIDSTSDDDAVMRDKTRRLKRKRRILESSDESDFHESRGKLSSIHSVKANNDVRTASATSDSSGKEGNIFQSIEQFQTNDDVQHSSKRIQSGTEDNVNSPLKDSNKLNLSTSTNKELQEHIVIRIPKSPELKTAFSDNDSDVFQTVDQREVMESEKNLENLTCAKMTIGTEKMDASYKEPPEDFAAAEAPVESKQKSLKTFQEFRTKYFNRQQSEESPTKTFCSDKNARDKQRPDIPLASPGQSTSGMFDLKESVMDNVNDNDKPVRTESPENSDGSGHGVRENITLNHDNIAKIRENISSLNQKKAAEKKPDQCLSIRETHVSKLQDTSQQKQAARNKGVSSVRSNIKHRNENKILASEPEKSDISKPISTVKSTPEEQTKQEKLQLPSLHTHRQYNVDNFIQFVLTWNPMMLKNDSDDFVDEISLPYPPNLAVPSYKSYEEYLQVQWPLLLIETFAQVKRAWKDNVHSKFNGNLLQLEPSSQARNFGVAKIDCLSDDDTPSETIKDPQENDLVILKFSSVESGMTEVFGVVDGVEKQRLGGKDISGDDNIDSATLYTLTIKSPEIYLASQSNSIQVTVAASLRSILRQWEALIRLPKSLLAKDILSPFRDSVFKITVRQGVKDFDRYNLSQTKAILSVSDAVKEPYVLPRIRLLQGPPGTGKSHTLISIVKRILFTLSAKDTEPRGPLANKTRLLICAPSNAAVDEVASRLIRESPRKKKENDENNPDQKATKHGRSNCGDFNLLRIGKQSTINPRIAKCSLEYHVSKEMEHFNQGDRQTIGKQLRQKERELQELDKTCTKLKMSRDTEKRKQYQKKLEERKRHQDQYEILRKKYKQAGPPRDRREEEKRIRSVYLRGADIICCTLSGSGRKEMVNCFLTEWNHSHFNGENLIHSWDWRSIKQACSRLGPPFTCVIIDEACQCCEPDALIPLQYGASKLVLVGDPAQLPATVLSQRASRYNYGQSLFDRLDVALSERKIESLLVLDKQYRMHPEICAFPSHRFYGGKLQTAREVMMRARTIPSDMKPWVVLNITESKERREEEGSLHNPEERRYVLHICKELIEKHNFAGSRIGIITPYRKQVQKLRQDIGNRNLNDIEVNTIDGFQGREKDVILLSCVRAKEQNGKIGFLQDPQRMNVALTRAKQSLIILTHTDSIKVDEDWKALIYFARSQKMLFDVKSLEDAKAAVFTVAVGSPQLLLSDEENQNAAPDKRSQKSEKGKKSFKSSSKTTAHTVEKSVKSSNKVSRNVVENSSEVGSDFPTLAYEDISDSEENDGKALKKPKTFMHMKRADVENTKTRENKALNGSSHARQSAGKDETENKQIVNTTSKLSEPRKAETGSVHVKKPNGQAFHEEGQVKKHNSGDKRIEQLEKEQCVKFNQETFSRPKTETSNNQLNIKEPLVKRPKNQSVCNLIRQDSSDSNFGNSPSPEPFHGPDKSRRESVDSAGSKECAHSSDKRFHISDAYFVFPHTHSNGRKCTERCATAERLPHTHKDGTVCVDKCPRLEKQTSREEKVQPSHQGDPKQDKSRTETGKTTTMQETQFTGDLPPLRPLPSVHGAHKHKQKSEHGKSSGSSSSHTHSGFSSPLDQSGTLTSVNGPKHSKNHKTSENLEGQPNHKRPHQVKHPHSGSREQHNDRSRIDSEESVTSKIEQPGNIVNAGKDPRLRKKLSPSVSKDDMKASIPATSSNNNTTCTGKQIEPSLQNKDSACASASNDNDKLQPSREQARSSPESNPPLPVENPSPPPEYPPPPPPEDEPSPVVSPQAHFNIGADEAKGQYQQQLGSPSYMQVHGFVQPPVATLVPQGSYQLPAPPPPPLLQIHQIDTSSYPSAAYNFSQPMVVSALPPQANCYPPPVAPAGQGQYNVETNRVWIHPKEQYPVGGSGDRTPELDSRPSSFTAAPSFYQPPVAPALGPQEDYRLPGVFPEPHYPMETEGDRTPELDSHPSRFSLRPQENYPTDILPEERYRIETDGDRTPELDSPPPRFPGTQMFPQPSVAPDIGPLENYRSPEAHPDTRYHIETVEEKAAEYDNHRSGLTSNEPERGIFDRLSEDYRHINFSPNRDKDLNADNENRTMDSFRRDMPHNMDSQFSSNEEFQDNAHRRPPTRSISQESSNSDDGFSSPSRPSNRKVPENFFADRNIGRPRKRSQSEDDFANDNRFGSSPDRRFSRQSSVEDNNSLSEPAGRQFGRLGTNVRGSRAGFKSSRGDFGYSGNNQNSDFASNRQFNDDTNTSRIRSAISRGRGSVRSPPNKQTSSLSLEKRFNQDNSTVQPTLAQAREVFRRIKQKHASTQRKALPMTHTGNWPAYGGQRKRIAHNQRGKNNLRK